MNALIKKEIRLLLPAWIVAVLLAMVQAITRPYDFYVASLLFFGLTLMALSSIGRETSLNTFSSLLAQPAERIRIWQTKLTVLAAAFLSVFIVWLAAFGIAYISSHVADSDREDSYDLFITVCLIATATFTGGLWTTLLVRQAAGAFWLTLLVPATLSGFSAVFFARSDSVNLVIAVLSVVIGIYSIAGFFFARRLYFQAQDVGWSGGVIALPEWKFSGRAETGAGTRARKPVAALVKKEFRLQQGVLTGAAGLLVLHVGIVLLRTIHRFEKNSPGEAVTAIFWMLWLVLPVIVGCNAVAEERKAGVMESQLCLPASRRIQFVIKAFITLFLGVFLGGVMPLLVEVTGGGVSGEMQAFNQPGLAASVVAFAAWLALVSFFASSLAKSFLQAVGFGVATFFGCMVVIPLFTDGRMLGLDWIPASAVLPLVIAVPTIIITLSWLTYLNFKDFREGWLMWRRVLSGIITALLFILVSSNVLYHRAWEVFEPAEPAHGPAKLSLANPPELRNETYNNLLVRLPDGRVWFDYLSGYFSESSSSYWKFVWMCLNPLPRSAGPAGFIAGTNWMDASARHVDEVIEGEAGLRDSVHITGYADSLGIQKDGTLWVSGQSSPTRWEADGMIQVGTDTNWQRFARSYSITSVLLLKKDGTLWRWGTNRFNFGEWPEKWPGLRAFPPSQIGGDSDWTGLYWLNGFLARKSDGSVWRVGRLAKDGKEEMDKLSAQDDLNEIVTQNHFEGGIHDWTAYVRHDGTLWLYGQLPKSMGPTRQPFDDRQCGGDADWAVVANTWDWMVAIKNDGSLWQWGWVGSRSFPAPNFLAAPTRLGIHHDWISLVSVEDGVVSLAADGSLWFWPDPRLEHFSESLIQLPKQPNFLGNVFGENN